MYPGLVPTTPLAWLVLAGACAGHAALVVSCLNVLYGRHWPRRPLRWFRRLSEVVVLSGPALFWFFGVPHLFTTPNAAGSLWAGYATVCLALGLIAVPILTISRGLRRAPRHELTRSTQVVNVAEVLGCKPAGYGKHRRLARLPGNQVFQVEFTERMLCLPRLPEAWDGLSILHLSDLHLCGTPDFDFYQTLFERASEWEHDLVVLTGDVVDSKRHHRWIVPLVRRLRWRLGAYAILGNHDVWYEPELVRRRLRKGGMTVLGNRWEEREIAGSRLVIVGHEGPWFGPEPDLSGSPDGAFRLCLSHTPDNIAWARRQSIDLMLAGHNHGGQIRFPLIGSVFVPSRHGRRYDCGLFDEPPTLLHVSRGVAGQHPLRYLCRPEVSRLVLRPAAARSAVEGVVRELARTPAEPA